MAQSAKVEGLTHAVYLCTDHNEVNVSHNSVTTNYRLQDITDVHIMAKIQEDSE